MVFTREDGSPLNPNRITAMFLRHAKAAGLPRVRLHDVRHAYATAALISTVAMDASFGMLRDHTAGWGLGLSSVACVG